MASLTQEELKQKIAKARAAGIPDEVIKQKIGESLNAGKYTLSTPKSGSAPKEKGWLGVEKKGFEGSFIGNAATDLGENIKGLLSLPSIGKKLVSGELSLPELAGNVAGGIVNDYGELAQQPLQTAYNKPISTALNVIPLLGGAKKLTTLSKVGKAAKMVDKVSDVAETGKVLDKVSDLGQATKTAEGLIGSAKKVSPAARQYSSIFTVPTKRAKSLKPLETSQKYIDYGIVGKNIDELRDVNNTVNTVINATKNDILSTATKEVSIDNVSTVLKSKLKSSLSIQPEETKRILSLLSVKTPAGKSIGTLPAAEAFKLQQQLEQMGHQYLSHNTYLTSNMHDLQLGQALLDASEEIGKSLDDAFKLGDINQFKTPEYLAYLKNVSPKLAEEYLSAKTFKELRRLQSPFVKGEQMIDLTDQAMNSVGSKVAKTFGEAAYQVVEPTVSRVTTGILPKVQTAVAGAMESPIGKGLSNIASKLPNLGMGAAQKLPLTAMLGRNTQIESADGVMAQEDTLGAEPMGTEPTGMDRLSELMAEDQPKKDTISRWTKEDFDKMYQTDLQRTGGKNFAKIQLLEKRSLPAAKKAPPAQVQKEIRLAKNANNTLNKLLGEITNDEGQVIAGKIPGAFGARRYRALWGSLVDQIGYLRTGAKIDKEQRIDYEWMLPQVGDTKEELTKKIQDLREEFQGIMDMQNQDWSQSQSLDTYNLQGLGE